MNNCPHLYLFDVDGTLIRSGGAGRHSFTAAIREFSGKEIELTPKDLSGRTDLFIFSNALKKVGIDPTAQAIARVTEIYLKILRERVVSYPGEILPGISEALSAIETRGECYGVLTGNLREGAALKMGSIWNSFPFGVFGEISERREDLALKAPDLFFQETGKKTQGMTLIGDTPFDIEAAREAGAVAVAVTTGIYAAQELQNADKVYNSLLEFARDLLKGASNFSKI